jgi:ankyrin repeat protein
MAELEDVEGLQKRVINLAIGGNPVELKSLLEEHPGLDVDKNVYGLRSLFWACFKGHTKCARLLIDHKADVNAKSNSGTSALYGAARMGQMGCAKLLVQNGADVKCQDDDGYTPLMSCANFVHLNIAQYLLKQKADVHYRISKEDYSKNRDALCFAMSKYATDRTPGIAFAFLSCNTDAKNVVIDEFSTTAMRDAHIETYSHVQAYIDESHRILNLVLSEHVPVDPRFGLGQMGIYQEPLERTLEYLGLSMSNDQVVNASIDGEEGVKRTLIPGHLLNANHWFDKYESR